MRCLRHGGRQYKKRGLAGRHLIPNRTDISKRPDIVLAKTRAGDWEADTEAIQAFREATVEAFRETFGEADAPSN